jgi:autotransporter-associated beta strand protein
MNQQSHSMSAIPLNLSCSLRLVVLLAAFACLKFASSGVAATKTWDGSSSGYWSAGGNWREGTAPSPGDDLVFPDSGVFRFIVTNNIVASSSVFRSVTFEGSNYVVWGTILSLSNGISAENVSGNNTIFNDVELRSPQTFLSLASAALLSVNGDVILGTNTLTFNCRAGDLFMNGSISGSGAVIKTGAGTLRYSGDTANPYTGTTWVRDGTLLLNKLPAFGAMSGPLIIGENDTVPDTDIVRLLRDHQLPNDEEVTIHASGLLDINGFDQNVGHLVLNGGDLDAPSPGRILPLANITVNPNTNSPSVIGGRMAVASNPVIDVTGSFFSPDLTITAQLFGAGGLSKSGPGEVGLSASNSFTGIVRLNDGTLDVDNSFALGATNAGTVVEAGGFLIVRLNAHVPRETLSLEGRMASYYGSNSWAGSITLQTNVTIDVRGGDSLNINAAISGNFDLRKIGAGTLIFSGGAGTANSYRNTMVLGGVLELGKTIGNGAIPGDLQIGDGLGGVGADVVRITAAGGQIANIANVNIATSGLLDLNTVFETVHRIEGGGRIDLGTGTLDVDNFDDEFSFGGLIFGAGDLQLSGNATWTLSGNNTYTGMTTIAAGDGALVVDGSQPQSPIMVGDDADLAGRGVVGNIHCFGEIKPGLPQSFASAILTCSNVFFGSSTYYHVDIGGPAPGSGYDQLKVRGTNTLGGNSIGTSGTQLRVRVGAGFAPTEGQQFVILDNDGSDAIVGRFDGLPNNSIFTALTGERFHIRYSDLFGNDVVLTYTNPATRVVTNIITGGNGNGVVEVNECNFLSVVLTNTTGEDLNNVTGTLATKTPGVSVTYGTAAFPAIPAAGRGTNSTPFQFSTSAAMACGGNIQFDLVVSTATHGSFTLPIVIGPVGCGNGGGGCESCPERTINGYLGQNSLVQSNRLFFDELEHGCGDVRLCPGLATGTMARYFDAYTFENGESNACILVTLTSGGPALFSAAYTNQYDPSDLCRNYLTDLGDSTTGTQNYSFAVGPRARFVVAVHGVGSGDTGPYRLTVTGGSCRPVLNIQPAGNNRVVLDWSTAAAGYRLQQTNQIPLAPNPIWIPAAPPPVVDHGRFRVTNSVSGPSQFYELRKP